MSLIGTLHRRLLLVRRGDGCARTASVARDGWRGGLAGRGADVARSAGPFAPALFVYRAALFEAALVPIARPLGGTLVWEAEFLRP